MEYLWFIIVILIIIIIFQFKRKNNLEKKWSPDKDYYSNSIPRDLKENFIYQLDWCLEKRNIKVIDFLEYIDKDHKDLEVIVETILEKTSLVKLYLPKDLESMIKNQDSTYYPYRIRTTMKIKELLSGFEGSSFDYAYNIDNKNFEEVFTSILNTDARFKDRNFCTNIYFLIIKDKKLFYTNAYWFSAGDAHWWPMSLKQINYIDDDGLNDWLNENDILMLPKKIN
tara:strand:+ start:678 stop:1355 length:678 start_codon:yes stop_codon:yes gene_type:complete